MYWLEMSLKSLDGRSEGDVAALVETHYHAHYYSDLITQPIAHSSVETTASRYKSYARFKYPG